MIKKRKDMKIVDRDNIRGGVGTIRHVHFLDPEESCGAGRLFATATIPPGATIGQHPHEGEYEMYLILKGTVHMDDNGTPVVLEAGDLNVCYNGQTHALENRSDTPAEVLFIILYDQTAKAK